MPSNRTLIRIFVAFPSDVREERRRLYQVVKELNDVGGMADQLGCVLQVLELRNDLSKLLPHVAQQASLAPPKTVRLKFAQDTLKRELRTKAALTGIVRIE